MNQVSKIAAAVACVAAVGYAGFSWHMGQQAEFHTQQALDWVQGKLGERGSVQGDYRRGVFSDENTIVIELKRPALAAKQAGKDGENSEAAAAPAVPAGPLRLHIAQRVSHGVPGRVSTHLKLVKVEGLPDDVRQAFAQAEPPEVTVQRSLAGGVQARLLLPAGKFVPALPPGKAASHVTWQPLTYDVKLDRQGENKHITGQVDWPGVDMFMDWPRCPRGFDDCKPLQMKLARLDGQFDFSIVDELWMAPPGKAEFTARDLQITPGGGTRSHMKELTYQVETTRKGDAVSSHMRFAGSGQLGEVQLQAFRHEFDLDDINAAALLNAQQMIARAWSGLTDKGAHATDEERQAALAEAGKRMRADADALVEQLMTGTPSVRTRYSATIDGQAGFFEYSLALPAGERPGAGALFKLPPMLSLMQFTRFKADLRVPHAWGKTMAQMLNNPQVTPETLSQMLGGLVQQGFLKDEGGAWSGQVEVQPGGKVLINGLPM